MVCSVPPSNGIPIVLMASTPALADQAYKDGIRLVGRRCVAYPWYQGCRNAHLAHVGHLKLGYLIPIPNPNPICGSHTAGSVGYRAYVYVYAV
jgi:hypothetical protein